HGDRLRLAGGRHVALRGDLQPRLPGAAGRDPLPRGRLRPGQPGRRPDVRAHQPEDPLLMSIAELESAELALEAPSGLWREAFRRISRNTGAQLGFFFVFAFVFVAVLAPLIAPCGPPDALLDPV